MVGGLGGWVHRRSRTHSPKANSMTTTSSTHALDVEFAQVLAIPPKDLRPNERNRRHEGADISDLVASIPVIGILQPLIVLPADADDTYTLVAGHRRRAAAIELGLPTVPCIVAADIDAATQILSMLAENQHRSGLTVREEAQHYEQLTLLDWEPERIAKALGHTTERVAGALAINQLPDPVAQAADAGQLDLAHAAALTEFADDSKAIDMILRRARTWGFEHAVAEERRKREKKRAAEVLKAELTLADVKVTSRPQDLGGAHARADDLLTTDGEPIDPAAAAGLPGFRVYIDDSGAEPRAVAYCPNPAEWGYTRQSGPSSEDRAAAEAERSERAARLEALNTAASVRHDWLANTFSTAKAAKPHLRAAILTSLSGNRRPLSDTALADRLAGTAVHELPASTGLDRATRALVGVWIAGRDQNLSRAASASWGVDRADAVSYLDFLVEQGYALSEAETAVRDDFAKELSDEEASPEDEEEDADAEMTE